MLSFFIQKVESTIIFGLYFILVEFSQFTLVPGTGCIFTSFFSQHREFLYSCNSFGVSNIFIGFSRKTLISLNLKLSEEHAEQLTKVCDPLFISFLKNEKWTCLKVLVRVLLTSPHKTPDNFFLLWFSF